MAEECDGGSVQPANETLLDHPLMRYDNELVEDERDIGLILPNRIYDNQGQEIRETNQTTITNIQRQPQHQKTRKQRINRYCCNCFRNTQHACWTCCTKCCDCKCSDCDCCDCKSCSDCYDSCSDCYDSCCNYCDSCCDCYDSVRYQFRECCGFCFLPCVTLIRWTGGIFAMIVVTVTIILLTLIAYGAIDCTVSSIPTIVALGIVLALTGVCTCTFKYDSYCMRREGLCLFFIALFLGIFFMAAVVVDSLYVYDLDPEQQSTDSICDKYYNLMYIALSYFYALIMFTCCGCVCSRYMTRLRRFRV